MFRGGGAISGLAMGRVSCRLQLSLRTATGSLRRGSVARRTLQLSLQVTTAGGVNSNRQSFGRVARVGDGAGRLVGDLEIRLPFRGWQLQTKGGDCGSRGPPTAAP